MANEQRIEKSANSSEGGECEEKSPKSIEEINAEVKKAMDTLEDEGGNEMDAVESAGGMPGECEEMRTSVEETKKEAEEVRDEYLEESEKEKNIPKESEEKADIGTFKAEEEKKYEKQTDKEKEVQMKQAAGFVEENREKIEGATLKVFKKLGMENISVDTIKETMVDELIKALENKELLEELKKEGVISEDEAATIFMIVPIVKNAIEASRKEGGDTIKSIFEDPEQNLQYIAAAVVLLEKLIKSNKISDPKVEFIVKSLSKMLQNETFQKFLSELVAQPNGKGEEIVEQNQ